MKLGIMNFFLVIFVKLFIIVLISNKASALFCYQCNSNEETYCAEVFNRDGLTLEPTECDEIYEAKYCIKATGMYEASALFCYQCNSNEETYCAEVFNRDGLTLEPTECDEIYEAKYCIKATGMYEGTIGTRRFCSSRHHGNYCEYVRRPGDEREYRSCVYTCFNDGCNSGYSFSLSKCVLLSSIIIILLWNLIRW
ncbi:UPAR/Ly6 domain-containing protein bou [Parasteatoda tepidariorum]|uniref:UPAR/Ly6 domain-containing protein bou n=1 Tax=Parasteatoda tepidariorum TaxID=114398 RepID=UPI001C71CC37|nr:U-scoloptoxin(05)-Sm1a-like [Parasteatoda tepidariorum]